MFDSFIVYSTFIPCGRPVAFLLGTSICFFTFFFRTLILILHVCTILAVPALQVCFLAFGPVTPVAGWSLPESMCGLPQSDLLNNSSSHSPLVLI
jgi:hypothetical protein